MYLCLTVDVQFVTIVASTFVKVVFIEGNKKFDIYRAVFYCKHLQQLFVDICEL